MSVITKEKTIKVIITVPANQSANSVLQANLLIDPQQGTVKSYTIPQNEAWVLMDAWVKSEQPVDGILRLKRNFDTVHVETPPVNTLLVNNPSRPTIDAKYWEPGDSISADFINLEAGGSSESTVEVYLKFIRIIAVD